MARFDEKGKRTTAVFVREKRDGRVAYRREQYNIVSYNNDTVADPPTYVEGLPDPALRPGIRHEEVYDDVLIYDAPPYPKTSIGRIGS
jgi:hypothetical protein